MRAGVFNASKPLVRSPAATVSSKSESARASPLMAATIRGCRPWSVRVRILPAIRSNVEHPGSWSLRYLGRLLDLA